MDFEMKKAYLYLSAGLIFAFAAWTIALSVIDTQAIGPENSSVGFATINAAIHGAIGVNMTLYHLTDWLILLPIVVAFAFALLGFCQWIKRGSILKVDTSLLLLGAVYIVVVIAYAIFEIAIIKLSLVNCRSVKKTCRWHVFSFDCVKLCLTQPRSAEIRE